MARNVLEDDSDPREPASKSRERWMALAAAAIVGIVVFFLAHGCLRRGGTDHPMIGRINPQGGLRVRYPRSLAWIAKDGETDVHLWDTVHTGLDGGATVTLRDGNKTIQLDPNTLVLFRPSADGVEVLLIQGNVVAPGIRVAQAGSKVPPLPDPAFVRDWPPLAQRIADFLQREPKMRPVGELTKPRTPYRLTDFRLIVTAPQMTAQNARIITVDEWSDFRWTPVPIEGVQYRMQLKPLSKVARYVDYPTNRSTLSVQVSHHGMYECSVEARLNGDALSSTPTRLSVVQKRALSNVKK